MLIAGLLAHRLNGFFVFKDGYEYVLVLAVVSLSLAVLGPGRASLDDAAGITITGWAGGGIALGVAVVATAGLLATFYRPQPKQEPGARRSLPGKTPVHKKGPWPLWCASFSTCMLTTRGLAAARGRPVARRAGPPARGLLAGSHGALAELGMDGCSYTR